jgi:hypothetical protein
MEVAFYPLLQMPSLAGSPLQELERNHLEPDPGLRCSHYPKRQKREREVTHARLDYPPQPEPVRRCPR